MIGVKRNKRGTALASTLLLSVFLAMLGLALAGIASMNLTLANRNAQALKSQALAESAVSEVMYELQESMKAKADTGLRWDRRVPASPLKTFVDRITSGGAVLPGAQYPGEIRITFNDQKSYYSLDNLAGSTERIGWGGKQVPPFTLHLVVTTKLPGVEKHFETLISGDWDNALFFERGKVHLEMSTVDGNVFTGFYDPRKSRAAIKVMGTYTNVNPSDPTRHGGTWLSDGTLLYDVIEADYTSYWPSEWTAIDRLVTRYYTVTWDGKRIMRDAKFNVFQDKGKILRQSWPSPTEVGSWNAKANPPLENITVEKDGTGIWGVQAGPPVVRFQLWPLEAGKITREARVTEPKYTDKYPIEDAGGEIGSKRYGVKQDNQISKKLLAPPDPGTLLENPGLVELRSEEIVDPTYGSPQYYMEGPVTVSNGEYYIAGALVSERNKFDCVKYVDGKCVAEIPTGEVEYSPQPLRIENAYLKVNQGASLRGLYGDNSTLAVMGELKVYGTDSYMNAGDQGMVIYADGGVEADCKMDFKGLIIADSISVDATKYWYGAWSRGDTNGISIEGGLLCKNKNWTKGYLTLRHVNVKYEGRYLQMLHPFGTAAIRQWREIP